MGITKSFLAPLSMRAGMLFKTNVIQTEPPFWMTRSASISSQETRKPFILITLISIGLRLRHVL